MGMETDHTPASRTGVPVDGDHTTGGVMSAVVWTLKRLPPVSGQLRRKRSRLGSCVMVRAGGRFGRDSRRTWSQFTSMREALFKFTRWIPSGCPANGCDPAIATVTVDVRNRPSTGAANCCRTPGRSFRPASQCGNWESRRFQVQGQEVSQR